MSNVDTVSITVGLLWVVSGIAAWAGYRTGRVLDAEERERIYAQGANETAYAIMEAVSQQKDAEVKAHRERADQAMVASVLGGEVLS